MVGMREERFSGSGRGVEKEGKGERAVETIGEYGSTTGLVMKKKGKHKSTTGIDVSLTPDYREKEKSNNGHVIEEYILPLIYSAF